MLPIFHAPESPPRRGFFVDLQWAPAALYQTD
jgi:hypothetical protein